MAGHRGVVTLGVPADVLVAAGGKGSCMTPRTAASLLSPFTAGEWGVVAAAGGEAMRCLQTICASRTLHATPPAGTLSEAARFQATCGLDGLCPLQLAFGTLGM